MTYKTIKQMDGEIEFAIRECPGGWIVKFVEGTTKDGDEYLTVFSERVFLSEETLSEFVLQWALGVKRVRAEALSDAPLVTAFASRLYDGNQL